MRKLASHRSVPQQECHSLTMTNEGINQSQLKKLKTCRILDMPALCDTDCHLSFKSFTEVKKKLNNLKPLQIGINIFLKGTQRKQV